MKVPDKIYVREYPDGIAHFWESKKKEDVAATIPHEYIRKEALLEWAKEHKLVIETHGDERDAYLRGEYSALNSLIDKLNSM